MAQVSVYTDTCAGFHRCLYVQTLNRYRGASLYGTARPLEVEHLRSLAVARGLLTQCGPGVGIRRHDPRPAGRSG